MNNLCRDTMFPNFIYSMDLDVDRESLVKDIYSIKDSTPSIAKSNRGGWQSPIIKNHLETDSLVRLKSEVKKATDLVVSSEGLKVNTYDLYYWLNINQTNDYNLMHRHPDAFLAAVYYPFVPSSDASLTFYRTDGAAKCYDHTFSIPCRTNMLCIFTSHLYHAVNVSRDEQDRISIAYNAWYPCYEDVNP